MLTYIIDIYVADTMFGLYFLPATILFSRQLVACGRWTGRRRRRISWVVVVAVVSLSLSYIVRVLFWQIDGNGLREIYWSLADPNSELIMQGDWRSYYLISWMRIMVREINSKKKYEERTFSFRVLCLEKWRGLWTVNNKWWFRVIQLITGNTFGQEEEANLWTIESIQC